MAELYKVYSECFKKDKKFWEKIASEEKEHASIIGLGKTVLTEEILSKSFLYDKLDEMKKANLVIEKFIAKYKQEAPSREEAYDLAIKLEETFYESFYQKKMSEQSDRKEVEILQRLNKESIDHAERIKDLLANS